MNKLIDFVFSGLIPLPLSWSWRFLRKSCGNRIID